MAVELPGSTDAQQRGVEAEVHDVLGVAHRILIDSDETDGRVSLVEVSVSPGAGSPPHADRNEDLVWYVLEGSIDFEVEGRRQTLGAGDAVFMARNSRHMFTNSADRPARAILLAAPGGVEGFFREAALVLAGAPAGPPPPATAEAFAHVALRYGIELYST